MDGVALLAAWETAPGSVCGCASTARWRIWRNRRRSADDAEQAASRGIVADALDLADSVSDLLMAEGAHQIVQGNPDRAAAAMAVADKQALPIETNSTARRAAARATRSDSSCCVPSAAEGWPRRPAFAHRAGGQRLARGDARAIPARYRFAARVHRVADAQGNR